MLPHKGDHGGGPYGLLGVRLQEWRRRKTRPASQAARMKIPRTGVGRSWGRLKRTWGIRPLRGNSSRHLSETDQRRFAKMAFVTLERALLDAQADGISTGDRHRSAALRARWPQVELRGSGIELRYGHAFLLLQAGARTSLSHQRLAQGRAGDAFHSGPIALRVCAKLTTFKVNHC
jgi:hypothetical protein